MDLSTCTRDWLLLKSTTGVKPARWVPLLERYAPARLVSMARTAEGRKSLERLTGVRIGSPDPRFADRQIGIAMREGYGIKSISDPDYPPLLLETSDPPPVLFHRGDPAALIGNAICIVGSRRASRSGLVTAERLAGGLARRGIVVVSGLARGIDRAAHEGALSEKGCTCAVLGCGIDVIYPREHDGLARDIADHGCIVTEFPMGTQPLKYHFPMRNRILSGLSLGTVVVEAALRSGAMNTAAWALRQNREVFAVPGSVERETSRGPHRLLRDGARLVETIEDILAELPPGTARSAGTGVLARLELARTPTSDEKRILSALELDPKHIDEIAEICHIPATSALITLLELEIRGIVDSCGGGRFALSARSNA